MSPALFINGVFKTVLVEILAAQATSPMGVFFLQPYKGNKIKLLAESTPTSQNPIDVYLSVTDSLAFVSFRAKVVGWQDKREIRESDRATLNQRILAAQPSEKEIYLTTADGKPCVNLIYVTQLEPLQEPIPVSCFVKISDHEPLKPRTTSGGWAYVYAQPSWLGTTSMAVADDVAASLASKVAKSLQDSAAARKARLAAAPKMPEVIQVLSRAFLRNPDVITEVLRRADGKCERCHAKGPFLKAKDGTVYLEIHHRKLLALGGEDTVENAIALCPNCHREMHFGQPSVPI